MQRGRGTGRAFLILNPGVGHRIVRIARPVAGGLTTGGPLLPRRVFASQSVHGSRRATLPKILQDGRVAVLDQLLSFFTFLRGKMSLKNSFLHFSGTNRFSFYDYAHSYASNHNRHLLYPCRRQLNFPYR